MLINPNSNGLKYFLIVKGREGGQNIPCLGTRFIVKGNYTNKEKLKIRLTMVDLLTKA